MERLLGWASLYAALLVAMVLLPLGRGVVFPALAAAPLLYWVGRLWWRALWGPGKKRRARHVLACFGVGGGVCLLAAAGGLWCGAWIKLFGDGGGALDQALRQVYGYTHLELPESVESHVDGTRWKLSLTTLRSRLNSDYNVLHKFALLGNDKDRKAYGWVSYFCGYASGYVNLRHPNGQLVVKGRISRGVPRGIWRFYDEEGTLIAEGNQRSRRSWKYHAGFDEASFVEWMERWHKPIWISVDEGVDVCIGFFGVGPPVWHARREGIFDEYYPMVFAWGGDRN